MSKIAGSLKSVTIEGVGYDVLSDTNMSNLLSQWENDSIATSGKAIHKKTKRVPAAEGIVLGTSWEEKETLIDLADGIDTLKFSVKTAGGDILKCEGHFNLESDESEEMRTSIKIIPDAGWIIFAA